MHYSQITAQRKGISWIIGLAFVILLSLPLIIQESSFMSVGESSLTLGITQDFIRRETIDGVYSILKSSVDTAGIYEHGIFLHSPMHLYAIGVVGSLLVGAWMSIILPLFAIIGIVVFSSLLIKQIGILSQYSLSYGQYLAAWTATIVIIPPSWLNGFQPELFYLLFTLAGLTATLKFYQTHQVSIAFAALMLFAFSAVLGTHYIFSIVGIIVVFIIQIVLYLPRRKLWNIIPLIVIVPVIIGASYYAMYGQQNPSSLQSSFIEYSFVEQILLQPNDQEYQGLEAQLQESSINSSLIEKIPDNPHNHYPSFITMIQQGWDIGDIYHTLNQNNPINIVLFAILISFTTVFWFIKSKAVWSIYMILVIPYIIITLTVTTNTLYTHSAILILILSSTTLIYIIFSRLRTSSQAIIFILLILSLFQSIFLYHRQETYDLTHSYWGISTEQARNAWPELMQWIVENTPDDARIFTSYTSEITLHTEREALWDPKIWFIEDADETLQYWDDLFRADYVLIKSSSVRSTDHYTHLIHIPEDSTLYRLILISNEVELKYQLQDFSIYKRTNI